MSSKSTATPENALTKEEIDERLARRALARLATYPRGRDDPPDADLVHVGR